MSKQIETLITDVYSLFKRAHTPSEENLELFCTNVKAHLKKALEEDPGERREPVIRFSNIGKPDRLLWYTMKYPDQSFEYISPSQKIKFLYGNIIEELVLLFVRESGHTVSDEQKEVEIEGIKGHMDCVIDGVMMDVKSTSGFAYKKFEDGSLREKDPFGYVAQISGYTQAEKYDRGGFLVMNKETGDMTMLLLENKYDMIDAKKRIKHINKLLSSEEIPERCYTETKEPNGNRKLDRNCKWCQFKELCWKESNEGLGLRVFKYSTGNEFFTKIVKKPNVEEITEKFFGYDKES